MWREADSVRLATHDFLHVARCECPIGGDADRLFEKPYRAVSHQKVGTSRMEAAETPLTQVHAGRSPLSGQRAGRGDAGGRVCQNGQGVDSGDGESESGDSLVA